MFARSKENMEFASCPFNPQHRMLRVHLQRHIIKCMVNYPDYVQCLYNSLHWFENKEKMMEHLAVCPSQRVAFTEKPVGISNVVATGTFYDSKKFNLNEENWDEEYR
jgi:hypothetical protein